MIDTFFANRLLPEGSEEQKLFLSYLMKISREGHLCLEIHEGIVTPPPETPEMHATLILGAQTLPEALRWIHREGNRWYLERNWKFEERVLTHLQRLSNGTPGFPVERVQTPEGLEPAQVLAFQKAFSDPFLLIAGGPGTGKSFVAACIVKESLKNAPENFRIVVVAPTGKAAAHLESKLPKDRRIRCGTLHLLLGVRQGSDLNREEGYLGADLLIVDECSMIDVRMFAYLFASLETGTRVILMGDENQLPPIEGGSVFSDLVRKGNNCTLLTKCLRSERAEILELAENVKQGRSEHIPIDENETLDFFHYFPLPAREIPSTHVLESVCILSCMRQGLNGVDALNQKFVNFYLAQAKPGDYFVAPILITKNDHAQKLFNGQRGVLLRRIGDEKQDKIIFPDREISASLVNHFEYAYVLSVHKSQGSEYDHVILLIPPGSEVFGREMIYTAVTRARHSIKIFGKKETLVQALSKSSKRVSGINNRLLD